MATESHVWDQQTGESDADYARFTTYLRLGPGRSIVAAEQLHPRQHGWQKRAANGRRTKAGGTWGSIASKWSWPERADAWDAHRGRLAIENAERHLCVLFEKLAVNAIDTLVAGKRPTNYNQALAAFKELAAHYAPIEAATAALDNRPRPDALPFPTGAGAVGPGATTGSAADAGRAATG